MSINDPNDQQFDQNLKAFAERSVAPAAPSSQVRSRCVETLSGHAGSGPARRRALKRPALLSGVGLAAAIAIVAGLLFFSDGAPTVRAAVVLEKLSKQVAGDDLIEVTLDAVKADGVNVNGRLQIATKAIAGDINAKIADGDGSIEVDLSLAISESGGWILIRSLRIPDPQVQAIIDVFLPSGTETLLILPAEIVKEAIQSGLGGDLAEVRGVVSGQVVALLKEILKSNDDVGAVIEDQADGTVKLTLKIENAESFRNLLAIAAKSFPGKFDEKDIVQIDDEDVEDLIGATLSVVYDPDKEVVRSFSIANLGDVEGTIAIAFTGGQIDPALLDSSRVAKPGTRTLDIGAIMGMIESFGEAVGEDD